MLLMDPVIPVCPWCGWKLRYTGDDKPIIEVTEQDRERCSKRHKP
jgi:hypothetical protein